MNFCTSAIVCSAVLLGLAGPAVAQQSSMRSQASQKSQCFEQGYGLSPDKFPAAYNAPARLDVNNGWDIFVSGSFIYWWVGQDGMDFLGTIGSGITAEQSLFQEFKWHPGFKVSLGTNLGDSWVGDVEYTYMHTQTASANSSLKTPQSSEWRMHYDQLDARLSRPFYQGRTLTVAPYGGVRGFWLRQTYELDTSLEYDLAMPNPNLSFNGIAKDWAVGLLTGMETHWLLGAGFRFEGDFSASLLYDRSTKVSIDFPESDGQLTSFALVNRGAIRSMFGMAGGFGWGAYFDRQNYHIDLLANYEFVLLPNRTTFKGLVNAVPFEASANTGDLYMSGLTATLRLDF